MDLIEFLKVIFLGIVEGITEWLPISSTGHMILVDELIQMNQRREFMDFFFVAIQLGAILAVVILFWEKIWPFHTKKHSEAYFSSPKGEKLGAAKRLCNDYVNMPKILLWVKILIASLPAAVIGLLFDDQIDELLTGQMRAYVVAAMLILYGVLFLLIENKKRAPEIFGTEALSYRTSFAIGLMQCLAIIPGTSRSGATILGATLLGAERSLAAEFSFFLSIPAMFGGSAIKLLKFFLHGDAFTGNEILILLVGSLVAFLVSLFAIKFLMSYIKKHDFKLFGWYRIVLGTLILIYFALTR